MKAAYLILFFIVFALWPTQAHAQMSDGNIWDIWGWEENHQQEVQPPSYGDQSRNGWHRRADGLMGRRCSICGCDEATKGPDGTSGIACCCFMQINFGGMRWMIVLIPMAVLK